MSEKGTTNDPRTKAYATMVRRIARELQLQMDCRPWAPIADIDIFDVARSVYPNATNRMVEAALERAIRERSEMAEMWTRTSQRFLQEAEALKALRSQTVRARLRVVDGTRR